MEGSAAIDMGGIGYNGGDDTINITASERRTVAFQYLIHDTYPTFLLKATANSKIYRLSYNIITF
jgi:hypothetical protein